MYEQNKPKTFMRLFVFAVKLGNGNKTLIVVQLNYWYIVSFAKVIYPNKKIDQAFR